MALNELAYRFTETNYSTKNEVCRELKMTLIDNIWSNILSYRSGFNSYLTLKNIFKASFVYCGCPSTNNLAKAVEDKIDRICNQYFKSDFDSESYKNAAMFSVLSEVAVKNRVNRYEKTIQNILTNPSATASVSQASIINYYQALNILNKSLNDDINIDYVGRLYASLKNLNRISSFYRRKEDDSQENRVLIDRVYTAAPVAQIETMMDNFYSFINFSSLPLISKVIIAYFFIIYVKPFEDHNEEMAVLIAKSVLKKGNNPDFAHLINLEFLLNEQIDAQRKTFAEVQKTYDITYSVRFIGNLINRYLDDYSDSVARKFTIDIKNDLYQADDGEYEQFSLFETDSKPGQTVEAIEEKNDEITSENIETSEVLKEKPFDIKREDEPDLPSNNDINIPEESSSLEEDVQEIEQVVVETHVDKYQEAKVKEEKPKIRFPEPDLNEKIPEENRAAIYAPNGVDEKEAYKLERYLLEIEPLLKKGQARFFARHCTLGCRYTIQQYKKFNRCAYETARTSMDQLYELGYYKKEQIKNKFVYTPIKH